MFKAQKDGKTITLSNDIHKTAFKNAGWVIVDELPEPTPPMHVALEVELTLNDLKQKARELGITFGPNTGYAKLQERINMAGGGSDGTVGTGENETADN